MKEINHLKITMNVRNKKKESGEDLKNLIIIIKISKKVIIIQKEVENINLINCLRMITYILKHFPRTTNKFKILDILDMEIQKFRMTKEIRKIIVMEGFNSPLLILVIKKSNKNNSVKIVKKVVALVR